jgi:hypothetical protein
VVDDTKTDDASSKKQNEASSSDGINTSLDKIAKKIEQQTSHDESEEKLLLSKTESSIVLSEKGEEVEKDKDERSKSVEASEFIKSESDRRSELERSTEFEKPKTPKKTRLMEMLERAKTKSPQPPSISPLLKQYDSKYEEIKSKTRLFISFF